MRHMSFNFFGFFMLCLLANHTWALSCYEGTGTAAFNSKKKDQIETLTQEILVPNEITNAGTILWRSTTYTTQFTCFDTNNTPSGEQAYLYWDPNKTLSTIHNSIALGVSIDGIDYSLSGARLHIGMGTSYDYWNGSTHCRNIGLYNRRSCARPETITVRYSIFIKSTGNSPPKQGNIPNTDTYSIFQVDGEGGLNETTVDGNFRLKIRGLNNIRFVECNPQVTIEGSSGNTVDFGTIYTSDQNANKVIVRKPFTIKADLSQPDSGGVCNGKALMASFSASNVQNNNTLLPEGHTDIGIQLFKRDDLEALPFKTPVDLATINNGVAQNLFDAGLLQIASHPAAGEFNATATVEVTFK